jgi:hypothetical protein
MAADDVPGPRNNPRFKGTGAPATAADLNIISNHSALVGNRKVHTTDEREALAGADVWVGLLCFDTDELIEYLYLPDGWKRWSSDWIDYTPASTTLIPGVGGALDTKYRYVGGLVMPEIQCTFGSSGGTITGTAKVALPVARAALAYPFEASPELGVYYQASITRLHRISVVADAASTDVVRFGYGLPFGTSDVSTTIPADPISMNDTLHARFTYNPA